jgi:hypothetical protein
MEASETGHLVLDYRAIAGKMLKGRKSKGPASKDPSRIANISAIAPAGDDLWTASDEKASLEQLKRDATGYARAQNWDLAELFPDFAAAREKARNDGVATEADLEGLAFDPEKRRLWVVGSHCRGRGSMKGVRPETLREGVTGSLEAAPLRTLLGFVPLAANGSPARNGGLALPFEKAKGSLRAAVKEEGGHLAEALKWPSKENGFDIEGIAVKDTEVLLGLRGPAAGGFAVVMRLAIKIGGKGLSLRKRKGARYVLSYLPLSGLGIRDLFRQGDDVLVLAGPTMDLDAPFALYRWHGAFARSSWRDETLKEGGRRLEFLFEFRPPARRLTGGWPEPQERPEGIALIGDDNLLIVHDRPSPERLEPAGTLLADLFTVPWSSKPRRPLQ